MQLHRWLLAAGTLLIGLFCSFPASEAQTPNNERFAQKESADLQELLTTGLKVRTKSEREYVARIVKRVEEGVLPESLVKALYARTRAQHARYPLPYFQATLKQVAKEKGIPL